MHSAKAIFFIRRSLVLQLVGLGGEVRDPLRETSVLLDVGNGLVDGLKKNNQAGNYSSDNPQVQKVRKIIEDYVRKIDPEELVAVINELDDIEDGWSFLAGSPLVYRSFKNEKKLLKADIENDRFRTMNSMRSVDGQSGIYLLGGQ